MDLSILLTKVTTPGYDGLLVASLVPFLGLRPPADVALKIPITATAPKKVKTKTTIFTDRERNTDSITDWRQFGLHKSAAQQSLEDESTRALGAAGTAIIS